MLHCIVSLSVRTYSQLRQSRLSVFTVFPVAKNFTVNGFLNGFHFSLFTCGFSNWFVNMTNICHLSLSVRTYSSAVKVSLASHHLPCCGELFRPPSPNGVWLKILRRSEPYSKGQFRAFGSSCNFGFR